MSKNLVTFNTESSIAMFKLACFGVKKGATKVGGSFKMSPSLIYLSRPYSQFPSWQACGLVWPWDFEKEGQTYLMGPLFEALREGVIMAPSNLASIFSHPKLVI